MSSPQAWTRSRVVHRPSPRSRRLQASLSLCLLFGLAVSGLAQQAITGSTTWTGPVPVAIADPTPIGELIGQQRVAFGGITLDGTNNAMEISAPFIDAVMHMDDASGQLTADLVLFEISVNSEGEGERHYLAVEGGWRGLDITLELDYEPGLDAITGSAAGTAVTPTPYRLEITDGQGRRWVHEGITSNPDSSPQQPPGDTGSRNEPAEPRRASEPARMEPARDEQYAALHGTVRGPSGPPLSGARVFVTSDDHRHLYGTAISATGTAHGRYQILSLPPEEPLRLYAYHENVPGVLYSRQLTLAVNEFRDQLIMLEVRHRDPGMIGDPAAGLASVLERLAVLLEQNLRRQWAGDLREMLEAVASLEQRRTARAHVLLLIDSSGSMQDNDPNDVRHSVARYVADRLPPTAALGLLDFDGEAKLLVPVREGAGPRQAVRDAVSRIDADGGTNIGGALDAGLAQYHTTAPAARRAAILLTDGQGEYDDQAATYASQDITLYTVGLGDQCDEALLSAMAAQTGGAYFKAGEAGGLFRSFEAAIVDVNDEQSFYTEQGTMVPEEHRYVTFDVEVGLDHLVSMITWPGSDLDLRLHGPDGQEVTAQRTAADRYEILRVDHPQPGRWRAEIEAVDVPDDGEPFTFSASGPSDVRLQVDSWPGGGGDAAGDTADGELRVRMTGGDDLRGLDGHLLVEAPTGRTFTVRLRRGADPTVLTTGTDWAAESGDYQVRVVVEGRQRGGKLRRELHRTLHVAGGAAPTPEDRFIRDLAARDAGTRLRAVKELGRRGHQGAVPAIRELLGDPSAEVRTAAAWALARLEKSTP